MCRRKSPSGQASGLPGQTPVAYINRLNFLGVCRRSSNAGIVASFSRWSLKTRWTMRWKPALNAFAVTFTGRMPKAQDG
jgi:hypothetical protein